MKTLNYLFLTGLFLLFSCQKEQFTTDEAAAAGPVNGTVPFRSDTYAERDATLVSHFYEDLLAIQQRTHFYDSFFHDYGYFNWAGSLEYTTEDVGKVLVVPVKSSPTGIANGVFMYFDNGTDRRMKFVRRHVVEGKIAENRLAELSGDEVFAYRNFLLTDLKNAASAQLMPPPNGVVFFRDSSEGGSEDPGCEGGSYQHICVYNTSGSGGLTGSQIIDLFMDSFYGTSGGIRDQFDGYTIAQLRAYMDNQDYQSTGPGGVWRDDWSEFQRYFNDRIALFNATNIDDSISGI